jgi:phosphoglycerate kinase
LGVSFLLYTFTPLKRLFVNDCRFIVLRYNGTMPKYSTLSEADLSGKRVLLRAGFDLPIEDGVVTDISRVEALVPTMQYILDHGASLVILSHQGRPKGKANPEFTQKPLIPVLGKLLGTNVHFASSCVGGETYAIASAMQPGDILLLENLRFDPREEANDPDFAKQLASLGDVYVNDAFTNCHRAHASMVSLPALLPSFMGLQLEQEVTHLSKVVENPVRPLTLIISGAKMETKVPVIEFFLGLGDDVLLGGAMANTFIAATGKAVGTSLFERDYGESARTMMERTDGARIHVPTDVVVAPAMKEDAPASMVSVDDIPMNQSIFDIGDATVQAYIQVIEQAKTIVWNGPIGVYEVEQFSHASRTIADAIAKATTRGAITIIGGGDTIDLHTRYVLPLSAYTFVSTGGGAMLEFVSGQRLPALVALERL